MEKLSRIKEAEGVHHESLMGLYRRCLCDLVGPGSFRFAWDVCGSDFPGEWARMLQVFISSSAFSLSTDVRHLCDLVLIDDVE